MAIHTFIFDTAPPSLNNSTLCKGGRKVKSPEYRAWIEGALWDLKKQRGGIREEFAYWRSTILMPPKASRADLDNICKALHDVLVKAGKAPDDRYLVEFTARYYSGDVLKVEIEKEPLEKWFKIIKPSKYLIRKMENTDVK